MGYHMFRPSLCTRSLCLHALQCRRSVHTHLRGGPTTQPPNFRIPFLLQKKHEKNVAASPFEKGKKAAGGEPSPTTVTRCPAPGPAIYKALRCLRVFANLGRVQSPRRDHNRRPWTPTRPRRRHVAPLEVPIEHVLHADRSGCIASAAF